MLSTKVATERLARHAGSPEHAAPHKITAGRAVRRFGPPTVLAAGVAIAAAGLLWLWLALTGDSYAVDLLPGLLLSGFGHGAIYTSMFIIGTHDVPHAHQGSRFPRYAPRRPCPARRPHRTREHELKRHGASLAVNAGEGEELLPGAGVLAQSAQQSRGHGAGSGRLDAA